MATQIARPKAKLDERFLARQRWARVGWVYGAMLALTVFFIGPFYVAFLGSLKDNPLEYPFRYYFAQLQPANWVAAWRLGQQGAGNPWTGGFAPGAKVPFEVAYRSEGVWGSYKTHPFQGWDTWTPPRAPQGL